MITKEKTNEFIDRAYKCACEHGFHDKELSIEHFLMLVITEVSEAVEADRKNKRADLAKFENAISQEVAKFPYKENGEVWKFLFEENIKSSVEDELADVCIRLYDICGTFGLDIDCECGFDAEYESWYRSRTFCELCYSLSARVVGAVDDMSYGVQECLRFCYSIAHVNGIDLERHIELKMQYNESRPVKHGKKY